MDVDLTLKNYRSFPDSSPARISLRKGFTAFVGANNSGKSSIFRFLYEFRGLFQLISPGSGTLVQALRGQPITFGLSGVSDSTEIFSNRTNGDIAIQIDFEAAPDDTSDDSPPFTNRVVITVPRNTNNWSVKAFSPLVPEDVRPDDLRLNGTRLTVAGGHQLAELSCLFDTSQALAKAIYIGPFRNVINVGGTANYFDIDVGQQFVARWRAFQTGDVKSYHAFIDRLTEDIRRIFRFDRLQILASEGATTLQLMINGRSFKLSEVGSAMAQFILVLANAAVKEPSYVLIDEPELNLHPSLQLDFLTTLGTYATHGLLFATHSIGLARAAADRIYSFRQLAEGESRVTPYEETPRLSEFLGELNFGGYQELGFDKILLVEGKTDIKTVHQFLRLHRKEHQVVLLPLGGHTLINERSEAELQEIRRISDNISALIDSERDAPNAPLPANRQAFHKTCQGVGIRCHVLKRRAIENYFSDRAVKAVKGEKYQALGQYEALKAAALPWGKEENWRIAREMTADELAATDLGEFLGSL
jgi:hypothetical protein